MRARVVGDQLRRADPGEVLVARVGNFDRRVDGGNRVEHFAAWCREAARRQADPDAERELRFRDPHVVLAERKLAAVRDHAFAQQTTRERTVDGDVSLAGLARGRDLPAEQRRRGSVFEPLLDGIALLPRVVAAAVAGARRSAVPASSSPRGGRPACCVGSLIGMIQESGIVNQESETRNGCRGLESPSSHVRVDPLGALDQRGLAGCRVGRIGKDGADRTAGGNRVADVRNVADIRVASQASVSPATQGSSANTIALPTALPGGTRRIGKVSRACTRQRVRRTR